MQLIYAHAQQRVLGKDGGMPWHLPEDLARFRRLTLGQAVLMGRKTWLSLPTAYRPLPKRLNLVLSRARAASPEPAALNASDYIGARLLHSFEAAQAVAQQAQRQLWVIGGAEVLAQALPHATRIAATEIDVCISGADTWAPELGADWQSECEPWQTSGGGLRYRFVTHTRVPTVTDSEIAVKMGA